MENAITPSGIRSGKTNMSATNNFSKRFIQKMENGLKNGVKPAENSSCNKKYNVPKSNRLDVLNNKISQMKEVKGLESLGYTYSQYDDEILFDKGDITILIDLKNRTIQKYDIWQKKTASFSIKEFLIVSKIAEKI